MSDTSDTSTIDDKQNEKKNKVSNDLYVNAKSFIISVIVFVFAILVYFTTSGVLLYACKVAQSNIMPTDINAYPYTETKPVIKEIETNVFVTDTDLGQVSEKIKFSYDKYNSSNVILDMLHKYKNTSNANFFTSYIFSILESLINSNYSILNYVFNTLNETFSEPLIVFLAPILFFIILPFIFLYNLFYLLYLWLYNMKWFFKTNTNETGTGNPEFVDVTVFSPIKYGIAVWLVIIWLFVLLVVGLPLSFVFAFISLIWSLFSSYAYKGTMNGKSIGSLAIVKDVFKYYKIPIMSIFSIYVTFLAFTKLGTVPGIFSIITLALIYFGIIGIDMFKPINEEKLSPVVSYEQAAKTDVKPLPKQKNGFLSSLIFGNQSGGSLTRELKNISKISKHILIKKT
jgi:hypothetical protein